MISIRSDIRERLNRQWGKNLVGLKVSFVPTPASLKNEIITISGIDNNYTGEKESNYAILSNGMIREKHQWIGNRDGMVFFGDIQSMIGLDLYLNNIFNGKITDIDKGIIKTDQGLELYNELVVMGLKSRTTIHFNYR